MIATREIKTTEDGLTYSDQVTILYQDQEDAGRRLAIHCDPDGLYDIIHRAVVSMSTFGAGANEDAEEKKKKNLAKLLKLGVKGLLTMYGMQILDILFGTKDHPKPGKQDDLLDWYQDMFTRIGISYLMKNDTILEGRIVDGSLEQATIGISTVTTRPVSTDGSDEARTGIASSAESDVNPLSANA